MQGTWVLPLVQKIPHAIQQLNPYATTIEPECLEPMLSNKRNHGDEKPTHHNWRVARFPEPGKTCVQQQRLSTAKNKYK